MCSNEERALDHAVEWGLFVLQYEQWWSCSCKNKTFACSPNEKTPGGYASKCQDGTFLQMEWRDRRSRVSQTVFLNFTYVTIINTKGVFFLTWICIYLCGQSRKNFKRTKVIQVLKFYNHVQFLPLACQGGSRHFPDTDLALLYSVYEIKYKHCHLFPGTPLT